MYTYNRGILRTQNIKKKITIKYLPLNRLLVVLPTYRQTLYSVQFFRNTDKQNKVEHVRNHVLATCYTFYKIVRQAIIFRHPHVKPYRGKNTCLNNVLLLVICLKLYNKACTCMCLFLPGLAFQGILCTSMRVRQRKKNKRNNTSSLASIT